jgi:glycosyltransferase involved in cell wall biosynthesis
MPANVGKLRKPIRLLAISFYYPPANNPRAVQVARLLSRLQLTTSLICGDDYAADDRLDRNGNANAEEFLEKCVRVPFSQPGWKRAVAKVAYQFNIRLWEKTPDRYVDWKPAVLKAIRDINQDPPDVLVTFGSPMSDHLIGLELKKTHRLPWVTHFSDPWVENEFKGYNSFTKGVNVALERKVVEAADRLIFTSAETVALVMKKYPESLMAKTRVLSHAFDPALFETSGETNSRIVIRYVGDLYGRRTPAPLFRALAKIAASDPDLLKDVCFEFVGSITDFKLSDIGFDELKPGLVTFTPTVAYRTSLALMSSADGLLVIDAPAETSVFLPSKLVDYIGAGRPVLGITPPGAASSLIKELGGWLANPGDDNDTEKALRSFITYLRAHKSDRSVWGDASVRRRFDAGTVSAQFEGMIEEFFSR